MTRKLDIFSKIGYFIRIKICPKSLNCPSKFKILSNTKETLKKLPKTFKFCKRSIILAIMVTLMSEGWVDDCGRANRPSDSLNSE